MKAKDPHIDVAQLREVLNYDPETGVFTWKRLTSKRTKVDAIAGNLSRGYISIGIFGHRVRAHRLAWFYVNGEWPSHDIDHINGKRDDNRLANLRDVTRSVNLYNQNSRRGTSFRTGLKTNPWSAAISIKNKRVHLGWYQTEEAANAAYQNAKRLVCMGLYP